MIASLLQKDRAAAEDSEPAQLQRMSTSQAQLKEEQAAALQAEVAVLRTRACRLAELLGHAFLLEEFSLWRDTATGALRAVERTVGVPRYTFHCEKPRRTEDIAGPLDDRSVGRVGRVLLACCGSLRAAGCQVPALPVPDVSRPHDPSFCRFVCDCRLFELWPLARVRGRGHSAAHHACECAQSEQTLSLAEDCIILYD